MTAPANKKYFTPEQERMGRDYRAQKSMAKKRGIPWEFTQEAWVEWWMMDDRISRRGNKRGQIMMCRYGDTGPYSPSNVYPGDTMQNAADVTTERRSQVTRKVIANGRRTATGEHHGSAKLTEELVRQIRDAKGKQRDIAGQFGVSQRSVGRIIRRENWRDVV